MKHIKIFGTMVTFNNAGRNARTISTFIETTNQPNCTQQIEKNWLHGNNQQYFLQSRFIMCIFTVIISYDWNNINCDI